MLFKDLFEKIYLVSNHVDFTIFVFLCENSVFSCSPCISLYFSILTVTTSKVYVTILICTVPVTSLFINMKIEYAISAVSTGNEDQSPPEIYSNLIMKKFIMYKFYS